MKIKHGARIYGLRPEMVLAVIVVNDLFNKIDEECVITCGIDDQHTDGSFHYNGLALDFRTRDLSQSEQEIIADDTREALGPDYDVVLEHNHLHIEFQPKEKY